MTRLTLAFVLWLSASALARAESGGELVLDEQRAVELALADNPALIAARDEAQAAGLTHQAGKLGLIPDVQVSGRYTRLSDIDPKYRTLNGVTFPQVLNQVALRVQVSVPLSQAMLNLAKSVRALGHAALAESLEEQDARAQLVYEARAAFLRLWRASIGVATASELERASSLQLEDQRARLAAGAVSPNDVLSFELAHDSAVLATHAARKELVGAEAGLRKLIPSAEGRVLSVHDDGAAAPRPAASFAASSSPRLRAMGQRAEAARESAEAAALERLPKLSVYGLADYAGPNPRVFVARSVQFIPTWEAGVRLEWALSQLIGGSVLAERARVQQHAVEARLEELRRTIRAEHGSRQAELAVTEQRIGKARERADRARALAEARRNELRAGTALPLNVIVAEGELLRAQNELADALAERALGYAQLDYLAGVVQLGGSARSAP